MSRKTPTCSFCSKRTSLNVPDDFTADLRWQCPSCEGISVIEGTGPWGMTDNAEGVHLAEEAPDPEIMASTNGNGGQ